MTPRFHPYAPLAAALALSAASLAAACVSVGAAGPGMAAITVEGGDGLAVATADEQAAYLHIDGPRIWVEFTPTEEPIARTAVPRVAARASASASASAPANARAADVRAVDVRTATPARRRALAS